MFWSDHGSNPHISSANMDGSNEGKIILTDIQSPNGLAIDFIGNRALTLQFCFFFEYECLDPYYWRRSSTYTVFDFVQNLK